MWRNGILVLSGKCKHSAANVENEHVFLKPFIITEFTSRIDSKRIPKAEQITAWQKFSSYVSHPSGCKVISHNGFDLHFPLILKDGEHFFMCSLAIWCTFLENVWIVLINPKNTSWNERHFCKFGIFRRWATVWVSQQSPDTFKWKKVSLIF